MKNDPAHLQGEPFGKYVWSVCVYVQFLLSKGNPVIVKVLNVFHLAILPRGKPDLKVGGGKPLLNK